jgi:hypothetical protein
MRTFAIPLRLSKTPVTPFRVDTDQAEGENVTVRSPVNGVCRMFVMVPTLRHWSKLLQFSDIESIICKPVDF